ncbi:MAG: type II toxin-antitoxin system Phd/YefM family antitoxin [Terrimicrobiaceae bacterium]|jgi:prevent-host-death family protein
MKPLVVGSFEAKNRLSELIDCVLKGQEVLILRRKQEVARLVPVHLLVSSLSANSGSWVERSRRIRAQARPGKETVKNLIEEGRR